MRYFFILFFLSQHALASEFYEAKLPTVHIREKQKNPLHSHEIVKSEKVSNDKLNNAARPSLSEILEDQPGVESQVYCSNCGAKRLTLNGLKGEHTSLLVDGLPLHSAVSSFYGVDNVPTQGIEEINVMRGSGASLTNPEAIGGTIDIHTLDPFNANNSYTLSQGLNDELKSQSNFASALLSKKSEKWGAYLGSQYSKLSPWDEDNNNIAESPKRESFSSTFKSRFFLGDKNDFTFRLNYASLEILGGAFNTKKPSQVRPNAANQFDFEKGSVEKKYIGDPLKVTDWIDIKRVETASTGNHYLSNRLFLNWKAGYARQAQDTIYQHGFDYSNIDNLFAGDLELNWLESKNSIFALGAFLKEERLRSTSIALFEKYPPGDPLDIPKDNFNHSSHALYLKHNYAYKKLFEYDIALRLDHISINWPQLSNSINEWILAPRAQFRHNFNAHLSQRLSLGLGYRAPLTFFESQHGNNENGYKVNITKLEKANSLVYSLSYNTPSYYLTGGFHYTYLQNMAYGKETYNNPILYENTDENFEIYVADLLWGYEISHGWMLEGSFESFLYEDSYKKKLPTAAIEQRMQIKSSCQKRSGKQAFLLF